MPMIRSVWVHQILAAFLGMAAIQAANAQATMEFACPLPGTKITTARGSTTSLGQEGFSCKVERGRDQVEIYALLHPMTEAQKRDPAHSKVIDPIRVERLWPLVVGKKHEGRASIGQNTFYLEYTVTGLEVIETPMGPQEAFVVELKETSTGPYRATGKWWISPKFRTALKGEFNNNLTGSFTFQVTAVEEPKK